MSTPSLILPGRRTAGPLRLAVAEALRRLRRWNDARAARARARADLALLASLGEATLRDIGLSPSELQRLALRTPLDRLEADAAAWRAWSIPVSPGRRNRW